METKKLSRFGLLAVTFAILLVTFGTSNSVFAEYGNGGNGTGIVTSCLGAYNAFQYLCGWYGSTGGGGSWRLYKGGGFWWGGTSITPSVYVGCQDEGYFVAYGYERLHGGGNNRWSSDGHYGIMGYHYYRGWDGSSWFSIDYNSYGAVSESLLKDSSGNWSRDGLVNQATANGRILYKSTAEALYQSATGSPISSNSSAAYFCLDPEQLSPATPTMSSTSSGDAYIGEDSNISINPKITWSRELSSSEKEVTRTVTSYFYLENTITAASASGATKERSFSYNGGLHNADASRAYLSLCSAFGYTEKCDTNLSNLKKVPDEQRFVGRKICGAIALNKGEKKKDPVYAWTYYTTTETDSEGNKYTAYHWYQYIDHYDEYIEWSSTWDTSTAGCVPIKKKLTVAINGSNIYLNGGANTVTMTKSSTDNKKWGSYAEFMVSTNSGGIAGGTNKGFSSGSGLANSVGANTNLGDVKLFSPLTTGNESGASDSEIKQAGIPATSSSTFIEQVKNILIDNPSSSVEIRRTSTIDGNIINNNAKNKQIIVYSEGGVDIKSNVTRVDAWIISGGTVNTCSDQKSIESNQSNQDTCTNKLEINGLVYAKSLALNRTYGGTANTYAERINLTPASYVWAYNQATSTYANPTTVYTREMAPRS